LAFYLWTCIGIAVGLLHLSLPGRFPFSAVAAIALGVAGAWGGALLASTVRQGGWALFGPLAVAGAIVGAAGCVLGMDFVARRARDEVRERRRPAGPLR